MGSEPCNAQARPPSGQPWSDLWFCGLKKVNGIQNLFNKMPLTAWQKFTGRSVSWWEGVKQARAAPASLQWAPPAGRTTLWQALVAADLTAGMVFPSSWPQAGVLAVLTLPTIFRQSFGAPGEPGLGEALCPVTSPG